MLCMDVSEMILFQEQFTHTWQHENEQIIYNMIKYIEDKHL